MSVPDFHERLADILAIADPTEALRALATLAADHAAAIAVDWDDPIVTYPKSDPGSRHSVDPRDARYTCCGIKHAWSGWVVTFPDAGTTCAECQRVVAEHRMVPA